MGLALWLVAKSQEHKDHIWVLVHDSAAPFPVHLPASLLEEQWRVTLPTPGLEIRKKPQAPGFGGVHLALAVARRLSQQRENRLSFCSSKSPFPTKIDKSFKKKCYDVANFVFQIRKKEDFSTKQGKLKYQILSLNVYLNYPTLIIWWNTLHICPCVYLSYSCWDVNWDHNLGLGNWDIAFVFLWLSGNHWSACCPILIHRLSMKLISQKATKHPYLDLSYGSCL